MIGLPERYVIKTNHGCANNIFVRDKTQLDAVETRRQLSEWLRFNYGDGFLIGIEWGYRHVKPAIIVEDTSGAGWSGASGLQVLLLWRPGGVSYPAF